MRDIGPPIERSLKILQGTAMAMTDGAPGAPLPAGWPRAWRPCAVLARSAGLGACCGSVVAFGVPLVFFVVAGGPQLYGLYLLAVIGVIGGAAGSVIGVFAGLVLLAWVAPRARAKPARG